MPKATESMSFGLDLGFQTKFPLTPGEILGKSLYLPQSQLLLLYNGDNFIRLQ